MVQKNLPSKNLVWWRSRLVNCQLCQSSQCPNEDIFLRFCKGSIELLSLLGALEEIVTEEEKELPELEGVLQLQPQQEGVQGRHARVYYIRYRFDIAMVFFPILTAQ